MNKIDISSIFRGGLLAALLVFSIDLAYSDKLYTVAEGEMPWSDRSVGTRVFIFDQVPDSIRGRGPFVQQRCATRSLTLSETDEAILVGVEVGDVPRLREILPDVEETGETLTLLETVSGKTSLYMVLKVIEPPSIIEGGPGQSEPLQSGLIFLGPTDRGESRLIDKVPTKSQVSFSVPESSEEFDLYVLMGQSNMVGRDKSGLASQSVDPRVGYLNSRQEWKLAREPMAPGGTGIGPGMSFAQAMLQNAPPNNKIGLVTCAVGGSPLSRWEKGGDLYENALKQAKAAQKLGKLRGILWHQGEQDTVSVETAATYQGRLAQMLQNFREDLGLPNLPIVIGQLGEFFKSPQAPLVRESLKNVSVNLPVTGFAESAGLSDMGDKIHFSAPAQVEFGRRYAEAMRRLQAGRPSP